MAQKPSAKAAAAPRTKQPSASAAPAPATAGESLGGEAFRSFDRMREALSSRLTGGVSPGSVAMASFDWAFHLGSAPGKRMELGAKAMQKSQRLLAYLWSSTLDPQAPPAIEPLPGDNRFTDDAWKKPPFSWMSQAFLLQQRWLHSVTHDVPGVARHHENVTSFMAKQMLDVLSPSNNPFTNPEVIARTWATGGMNFANGLKNLLEDYSRQATGRPQVGTEGFVPGETVALTPGKVVYRNHLIELIQYTPTTDKVHPEPVLIVPAWIMKYYILDLSPENSLISFLVAQGHTVFAVSWRNPDASDRDLELDDYRQLGAMAALDEVGAIVPGAKVHAVGYCLGGTLMSIVAAEMAGRQDDRLASLTLLAAQVDFTEPGELALFIDPSQLHFIESMMWHRGYLSSDQMSGAFQLLRSNDLVWSRMVREYMMGERESMIDLMAWNADSTRMPYRMHAEYLRKLYLDNDLSSGRLTAGGRKVHLQNIRVPTFAVGTERDHVAPWTSVYKIRQLADCELTFALTSGGHNAGIVTPPSHPRRRYRIATHEHDAPLLSAQEWMEAHDPQPGSWWTPWQAWLVQHSTDRVAPPAMAPALADAPGTYVFQR